MPRTRSEIWLAALVVALGLIPVALMALWAFTSFTATVLHPNPAEVPSVSRTAPPEAWRAAVDRARQVVRAGLAEQNLPGLSVAVGVGDDLVWAEGFGWADIEQQQPVTPETRFRIGTASTVLTAAAVGLLVEQGALSLDAPIRTYVPALPASEWPVTLRQVMAHVAGVRNDGGDEGPLLSKACDRPADALEAFADRPMLFEPGTRYGYSSYGWIVVSAAVEAAADEPFLSYMRNEVFTPLGMRDTEPDSAGEVMPRRATPYFPRFAADPRYGLHLMRPLDYSCYAGASVFLSTPADLVRFGVAVQGGRLLRPDTVALLQTAQRLTSGEDTGYGLGWDIEMATLAGTPTRWVGHEGTSLGGSVASLIVFPDRGIVVTVLSNISYADTEGVALQIAEAFVPPG